MTLKIENMVASIDLHGPIDVEKVANKFNPINYDPSVFPGAAYKMKSYGVTFLIFSSGKLVCTGAKNLETIKLAVKKLKTRLESMNMKFEGEPEIQIQNIVAAGDIGLGNIELETIAIVIPNVEYEPEIFPGLVYRPSDSRMSILIFNSGKVVISGAKSVDDIWKAIDELKRELRKYGFIS